MRRSTRPRCAGWARRNSSRSATGCTGPRKAAAAGRAAAAATAAAGDDPTHLRGERSTMTERVREILSWYASDNPGTLANLARLMNHGRLAGTGRFVILPVDQGFEHGPARSFAANPAAYDPLSLRARPGRRLQRVRGASRLHRGGRSGVRRADPAHPEAQ